MRTILFKSICNCYNLFLSECAHQEYNCERLYDYMCCCDARYNMTRVRTRTCMHANLVRCLFCHIRAHKPKTLGFDFYRNSIFDACTFEQNLAKHSANLSCVQYSNSVLSLRMYCCSITRLVNVEIMSINGTNLKVRTYFNIAVVTTLFLSRHFTSYWCTTVTSM